MPVLTPSRVAVVVLSLSLLSFLWTFGLPRQIATPSFPSINHDSPHVPAEPVGSAKTAGSPNTAAASAVNSFTLHATLVDASKPTPTPPPSPLSTAGAVAVKNSTQSISQHPALTADHCKEAKGADNVMVIVKTSKAEIYQKLPTHLLTLLSCVPNFAIFSDHAGTIDGYPVYDALESVTSKSKETHEEFREYEKMQQDDASRPESVTKELDKWKILPMVYKTYRMKPDARFYVFIEADTSLSWTNLLLWTGRLDYRIPYYSGAPSYLGDVKFAQRGSGILLSQGALKQYAKLYDERYESTWESRVGRECCGDMVLATALTESAVEYYSAFPLLQGETPATLDWTKRHWCAPAVTWHHMTPDDIDMLWSFQRNWTAKRGWDKPYLFRNTFEEFVSPHLADVKDEWDNYSQEIKIKKPAQDEPLNSDTSVAWYKFSEQEKNATKSADDCKAFCKKSKECMQWRHRRDECHHGKVVRLGRKSKKADGEEIWTSGWIVDKIRTATEEWGACEEPSWKWNQ